MILAICVVVDESKCLDIPDLEYLLTLVYLPFFTWVEADTASAACPAPYPSLEILSITFAAVICEADDPCSVIDSLNHLSQHLLGARLHLCIFEIVVPTPIS